MERETAAAAEAQAGAAGAKGTSRGQATAKGAPPRATAAHFSAAMGLT